MIQFVGRDAYKQFWNFSKDEKENLATQLAIELPALRGKVGASQEEIASAVGISRQTYSAYENRTRPIPWSLYLALAQSITQDLAEVTAKTVAEKMDVKSPTIIEKAYKADKPDSPSLKKNVLIGAVLGFILMAAAIVIQYLMNDTILKEEDIEKYLGIITLAQLPLVKGTTKRTKKVKRARE